MGDFDLSTSEVPRLVPLKNSFAVDQAEEELRDLICELFETELGEDAYDASAAGAAHLGTFGFVQRALNADGLVLLPSQDEPPATRYIYRAWKAQNCQGRGMAFLRAYLQMQFPNKCSVEQVWQMKDQPYPLGLVSPGDPEAPPIDSETMFLTSRIEVGIDMALNNYPIKNLSNIICSVIPARFVPFFLFRLSEIFYLNITAELTQFSLWKNVTFHMQFGRLLITEREDAKWQLGRNDDPDSAKKLTYRFVVFDMDMLKVIDVPLEITSEFDGTITEVVPKIGPTMGLKVNGTWQVPNHGERKHPID